MTTPARLSKPTDIPWLGEIPLDWEIRRLRWIAHISTGARDTVDRVDDGTYPFYVRSQTVERINSFSYDGEAVLTAGDGAGVGKVFHYAKGKFDFHQRVYKFSDFKDVSGRFFYRYFSALLSRETSAGTAKSTVDSLRRPMLQNFPIALPPEHEQDLIVRYLDHCDLRIGHAIESKRRLTALLDERRRAAIQRLVTAGTHQAEHVKASGIKWLGDVPANWEIRPAKFFFREVNERSTKGDEELLSVSHLTGVTPRTTKNVTMFMAASYVGHKVCRQGDLVVNTMWAWMGALGVAGQTGLVSPAYAVYRPISGSPLSPSYAGMLLRTQPYVDEYTCRSTGIRSSRLRLYPDRFLSIAIVCPPPDEQREIVERAEGETRGLTAAIAAALGEIDLLLEYRTRLIADVVTGKRDIRTEAESLPDVDPADLAEALSTGIGLDAGPDEEAEELADAV
jgi:type I restriction enzyme S subunit